MLRICESSENQEENWVDQYLDSFGLPSDSSGTSSTFSSSSPPDHFWSKLDCDLIWASKTSESFEDDIFSMSSIPELDLYSNLPIYPELEQMEHTDSSWNENSPSTEKPEEESEDIDVISLDDSIASPSTCGEKPAAFPCVPVPVANNTEKRLHHNFQERQRRCDLKLAFEDLRQVVLSRNPKAPKQMILDEALLRIGHLMEKEKQCITVKEFLLVQKQKLIEKLRSRR